MCYTQHMTSGWDPDLKMLAKGHKKKKNSTREVKRKGEFYRGCPCPCHSNLSLVPGTGRHGEVIGRELKPSNNTEMEVLMQPMDHTSNYYHVVDLPATNIKIRSSKLPQEVSRTLPRWVVR